MNQNYTIFINGRPLFMAPQAGIKGIQSQFVASGSIDEMLRVPIDQKLQWKDAISAMLSGGGPSAVQFTGAEPNEVLQRLKSAYKWVEAAGGLIRNQLGEILMIYRRAHWDLPKGKLDKGESLSECALREVEEETGVGAILLDELLATYHMYERSGRQYLKKTHWYHMKAESTDALHPQTEEDIEQVIWVNRADLPEKTKNTYSNIIQVLFAAGLITNSKQTGSGAN